MKNKLTPKQANIINTICSVILIVCFVCAAIIAVNNRDKKRFNYEEQVNDTIVTIGQLEVPLYEASYYILKMEAYVNHGAQDYNSNNIPAFWNLYINNKFIRTMAKDATMNLLIRDNLYYIEAVYGGMELTNQDIKGINEEIQNILLNMTPGQMSFTNYTERQLYAILSKIRLAEKYVAEMTEQDSTLKEEDFNPDGKYYKEIYSRHKIKINKKIWDKITLGKLSNN